MVANAIVVSGNLVKVLWPTGTVLVVGMNPDGERRGAGDPRVAPLARDSCTRLRLRTSSAQRGKREWAGTYPANLRNGVCGMLNQCPVVDSSCWS